MSYQKRSERFRFRNSDLPKVGICEFCKKPFFIKQNAIGKFCSRACHQKSKKGHQPKAFALRVQQVKKHNHVIGKCLHCGKPTIDHKYCSQNCFYQARRKEDKICLFCGIHFRPKNGYNTKQRFCSHRCAAKWLIKIGTLPAKIESASRKRQSNMVRGKPRPLEVRKRISKKLMGHKGFFLNGKHTEEAKKKVRIARLKQVLPTKDTTIERLVQEALVLRHIAFEKHYAIYPYQVDLYLPAYNLIIQADGCYWHGCPTHFPNNKSKHETDRKANEYLLSKGYRVLRLWEHDIRDKDVLKCKLDEVLKDVPMLYA